jgi:C-terminal processing protease CtpA/Prc
MADALLAHDHKGDDATATGETLATLLTHQLREVSQDPHLEVVYSATPLPPQPTEPTSEETARYQKAVQQQNCLFEKVQILPHNVGYLKLTGFPDPDVCRRTATNAMATLNHTDALIIDLRDNRGGSGEMVLLLAAYLFNHPQYIYDPRETPNPNSQTHSPIPGNKLADEPVYILTSASTISAAEQFTYNMKMLKRATLIGETTQGSAHAGVWYRIDDHFGIAIPAVKPHNPYSNTDWEAVGVQPDIKVKAANALEAAEKLAEKRLPKQ